jgi:hypothetical protein
MVIIFESTDPGGKRCIVAHDTSSAAASLINIEYSVAGFPASNVYAMHSLAGGRYGYKIRRHTDTTFATIATVGAIGESVVNQSYVLYVKPPTAMPDPFCAGLVGYWELNETAGITAADFSGNGNDGTLTNMTPSTDWVAGKIAGGLDFDGVNDYIDIGTFDVIGSGLTLTGWFNADTIGTNDPRIISKANGTNETDAWWQLSTTHSGSNRYLRMRVKAGGTPTTFADSSVNLTAGQWYLAVATYDNTSGMMKLYLDGTEVASGTHAVGGPVNADPTVPVAIGANGTVEQLFNGVLDDVRIYDRVLDPSEISQLHTMTVGGCGIQSIISTDSDAILGGLSFTDIDLVRYDEVNDTASVFFNGSLTTLNTDITAVHVLANGHIVLSTKDSATLGGVSFDVGDLVDYDPVADTARLIFDGSTLFDEDEEIISVHVMSNEHFILSTDSPAVLGGLSFDDIDLVEYDPVTDTASLFFDGSLTTLDQDITSVHVLSTVI